MASVFAAVNVARSSELVCVSAPPAVVSTNNGLAELGQPQGHLAISMWMTDVDDAVNYLQPKTNVQCVICDIKSSDG